MQTPDPSQSKRLISNACRHGQIKELDLLLERSSIEAESSYEDWRSISSMLVEAVAGGQIDTINYLLDRFPEFPAQNHHLSEAHDAMFMNAGGLNVYKTLLRRFPAIGRWDCGERGDHLGLAAMNNDMPFVRYLLDNGADASRAHFLGRPVLRMIEYRQLGRDRPQSAGQAIVSAMRRLWPWAKEAGKDHDYAQMIKVLESHGATTAARKSDEW
ncbi:Hypothetical protein D9617_2g056130 [Elsinoe fawcettii]|nr:Hypothetical protein D9617_2g056130 [Elsinoe fawcettii]